MKQFLMFCVGWLAFSALACGPISERKNVSKQLEVNKLPDSILFTGNFINAIQWEDSTSQHIVLQSQTDEMPFQGKSEWSEGTRYIEIYAYHFQKKNNADWELIWKTQDAERDCPFDLMGNFVNNSLTLTDLDKNGINEITYIYRLGCRSDVSPDTLILKVHEGKSEYTITGHTLIEYNNNETAGGDQSFSANFATAPKEIQDYAKQHWDKYVKFNIGD